VLDSHNNLYKLIMDCDEFVLRKISCDVVDFYCDIIYVYTIDTKNKIHRIDKYGYNKKYICDGHFGKPFSNTKSANNTYKQT
jgi:hypothetical protein